MSLHAPQVTYNNHELINADAGGAEEDGIERSS